MEARDLEQFTEAERKDLLEAETRMYSEYFEGSAEDKRPAQLGILAAILLHVLILYITFPSFNMSSPAVDPDKVVFVRQWRPPPPPEKEPPKPIEERKLKTKKIPIPDPTPEEPEPIKEPEPEPEPEPLPPDAIALIGAPGPPPVGTGPLIAGVGGVTKPIPLSQPDPLYPELARKAGIQGRVIIQAIISKDGSVKNAALLSVNAPNLGFEQAALEAVKQWMYKPAEQNGRPVEVVFNVIVTFTVS